MQNSEKYNAFAQAYKLEQEHIKAIQEKYEIDELLSFLPAKPNASESQSLKNLIGVTTESGYLDYQKSNNTFELIMQWREQNNRWE